MVKILENPGKSQLRKALRRYVERKDIMRQIDIAILRRNIRKSYALNAGFPVYNAVELKKIYTAFGVNPKGIDRRIFNLESLSHHSQREVLKLARMMGITREDFLLDIGCGNGASSRLIAKTYGCKILGVDLLSEQIKKAEECNKFEGVSKFIKLRVCDVHNLDFKKEIFDKIFHNESMCHWHLKKLALKTLYQSLKKGGCMGFHDWLRGNEGDLNDAEGSFKGIYADKVWFQNTLTENVRLLTEIGFIVQIAEDITDSVDRSLRARLKELELSRASEEVISPTYFTKTLRYFRAMIWTNYKFLRYGRFVCVK